MDGAQLRAPLVAEAGVAGGAGGAEQAWRVRQRGVDPNALLSSGSSRHNESCARCTAWPVGGPVEGPACEGLTGHPSWPAQLTVSTISCRKTRRFESCRCRNWTPCPSGLRGEIRTFFLLRDAKKYDTLAGQTALRAPWRPCLPHLPSSRPLDLHLLPAPAAAARHDVKGAGCAAGGVNPADGSGRTRLVPCAWRAGCPGSWLSAAGCRQLRRDAPCTPPAAVTAPSRPLHQSRPVPGSSS